ncbi:hypothetical protein QJU43_06720 [Pasteurella atlantica]|uniref:Uncharacterized protein n=1 Tax=Phocoenobacter skyensis TaxID=97481 RepID=A0A1H7VMR3_9PAST|nr:MULTISPECIES: hypothetical protein [Pasteurella]MDP8033851.1 hypothetical protein [Pasteurella atlantica]MDP8035786.1 hypothetical protein [Pasteurella atlantica]MDP8037679.1 hypothetical protein [Pasteurella atlantica]MDP8048087.1 hypothetical protein [Pasteurella atlantica]MDP8050110.1 hypothetical protein [Pasteurella atlantica]
MKIFLLLPSAFWLFLTALGFGAQSLANLVELVVIFCLSILCVFIPEHFISSKYVVIILLIITFLTRLLMPIIPE